MTSMDLLKKWFLEQKRDLPWRDSPTPYAVWVSEVMLQQTQVSVVIPYFLRWMELFPTIKDLANATQEQVIKAWEGLGYYSRARNLHQGAQYILEHHQGELPQSEAALAQIKGLGPYTIGAIRSFAFHQKAPAVDGNVVRVLSRYLDIRDDISKSKTWERLRQEALALLPEEESWLVNEALIELGATVCQKKPRCSHCPLKRSCKAYQIGNTLELPFKSAKTVYQKLERTVIVLQSGEHFLVRKSADGEIMKDLHQFAYFEEVIDDKNIKKKIKQDWQIEPKKIDLLQEVTHSFTKYRVKLRPYLCQFDQQTFIEGFEWKSRDELKEVAFSSGHRRIWEQI